MRLTRFIIFPAQGGMLGHGFVLDTKQPFCIAKFYFCKSESEFINLKLGFGQRNYAELKGYWIVLAHFTDLVNSNQQLTVETLEDMLIYYFDERVQRKPGVYKDYKIK